MTFATLENPSDLIANAARTILLADTPAWPFPVYAHRHLAAMNIARVEISAMGFERASDHIAYGNIANTATAFYDHRKGRLAFTVITQRTDQQNTDNHAYCVGRIGYLMSRPAQRWTPSTVQNLQILDIEDHGDSPMESEKTDTDRTTRHFTIEYQIPSAVWAAAAESDLPPIISGGTICGGGGSAPTGGGTYALNVNDVCNFTVTTSQGIGLSYVWKKDGVAVGTGSNYAFLVAANLAGVYSVTITNAVGTATASATLTVL